MLQVMHVLDWIFATLYNTDGSLLFIVTNSFIFVARKARAERKKLAEKSA